MSTPSSVTVFYQCAAQLAAQGNAELVRMAAAHRCTGHECVVCALTKTAALLNGPQREQLLPSPRTADD